ncbi:MAG: cytidylate kinase-like family protein [Prevotellaceae bacterium]|nr:cytidylate kinase-like family protein [Candidatus Colivivens equi]
MNDIFSITIGREIGSGGNEIAQILASRLDCVLYDKQILALAAKESGFSEKLFERHDERHGWLHNLIFNKVPIIGHANYYSEGITQGSLFQFQSDVIRKESAEKRCIFIGRCADYILRDKPNNLNVFIYADMEFKVKNIMQRKQCDEESARRIIREGERIRSEFYDYYTGQKWGDKQYYDICINSTEIGTQACAEYIIQFAKRFLKID